MQCLAPNNIVKGCGPQWYINAFLQAVARHTCALLCCCSSALHRQLLQPPLCGICTAFRCKTNLHTFSDSECWHTTSAMALPLPTQDSPLPPQASKALTLACCYTTHPPTPAHTCLTTKKKRNPTSFFNIIPQPSALPHPTPPTSCGGFSSCCRHFHAIGPSSEGAARL